MTRDAPAWKRMQFAVIAAIVIVIAAALFALQNNVAVTVVFLLWRFEGSLALILLLAVALGALSVVLASAPATLRLRWALSRQRREIDVLKRVNDELQARLRNAPYAARHGEREAG